MMAAAKGLGRRVSGAYGWAALGIIVVGSIFNVQQVVLDEPFGITAWLLGAVPALLLGLLLLPWASGRGELWRRTWWIGVSFGAVLLWSAVRTPGIARCLNARDGEPINDCFPAWVAWVPLLQAGVTAALAWVVVAAIDRSRLGWWLTGLGTTVVAMSGVALLRSLRDPRGFNRLGSGLGGAAVLGVALVIATAILVGCFLENRRRWPAALGAAAGLVLIVMTFSRAGFAVAVVSVIAGAWARRGRSIRVGRGGAVALGAVLVMGAGAALLFPELAGRMLSLGDPGRAANTATALSYWAADPMRVLLGAGTGRVWPWFGIDADLAWAPATGMVGVTGIDGPLLVNPHSTFLGVVVEGGVIGLLPLLVLLGGIVLAALRQRGCDPRTFALASAAASILAFFLDYYLFRNPGVSFVWWCAVFAGMGALSGRAKQGPSDIGARLTAAETIDVTG